MVKKNRRIFEELEKHDFPEEIEKVFELIKENPERIHFVKDHNGVKNLLFLTTLQAANKIFENPYFSLYTTGKADKDNTYHAVVHYAPDDIYKETKKFLENSDETLYVGIGFEENEVTNDDYWRIFYFMEESKRPVSDGFVSLRRFPEWYSKLADYPFYIHRQEFLLKQMQGNERQFLLDAKYAIFNELSQTVEKEDEEEFIKLCTQIKVINAQLKETSAF